MAAKQIKTAVYTGTRNLYPDMIPAVKSLLINSDVDRVYLLIEDDAFPEYLPKCVKTINVSRQRYFPPYGANSKSEYTYMALMRAALSKIFPRLDRILSLDVDTIVDRDISELWTVPLDNHYFAGVREPRKCIAGQVYTNIGVTVFNLAKMRKDKKTDEVIRLLNEEFLPYPEQDALNYLCQGHIFWIDGMYNFNPWTEIPTEDPKIYHFAAQIDWNKNNPIVEKYKQIPWKEIRQ